MGFRGRQQQQVPPRNPAQVEKLPGSPSNPPGSFRDKIMGGGLGGGMGNPMGGMGDGRELGPRMTPTPTPTPMGGGMGIPAPAPAPIGGGDILELDSLMGGGQEAPMGGGVTPEAIDQALQAGFGGQPPAPAGTPAPGLRKGRDLEGMEPRAPRAPAPAPRAPRPTLQNR